MSSALQTSYIYRQHSSEFWTAPPPVASSQPNNARIAKEAEINEALAEDGELESSVGGCTFPTAL